MPTRSSRATSGALLACLALASCRSAEGDPGRGKGAEAAAAVAERGPAVADGCPAGAVERRPLVLPDGRQAYVEPENILSVGEDLVVVGSPTYTWQVGAGPARMASAEAHIAAYLDGKATRLVAAPLDAPIGVVRAVALDDRRWAALFTETEPGPDGMSVAGSLVGLWYAEYDGTAWSAPEPVPMPDDGELFPETSSPPVLVDGLLTWVVVRNPEGAALQYTRRSGSWSVQVLEESGVEAAGLGAGPSGAWLALSGLDPSISEPRKSVRLFHRQAAGWSLATRDASLETYTEITAPSVTVGPEGAVVTWTEARGAGIVRTRVRVGEGDPGTVLTLDESAPAVRSLMLGDALAWVVWHAGTLPGAGELRLLRLAGDSAEIEQAIPYPYTGFYAAAAGEPGRVVVTGSEFSRDPARPTVRSLTLRLNPSCQ